jgi:hypothetical protein
MLLSVCPAWLACPEPGAWGFQSLKWCNQAASCQWSLWMHAAPQEQHVPPKVDSPRQRVRAKHTVSSTVCSPLPLQGLWWPNLRQVWGCLVHQLSSALRCLLQICCIPWRFLITPTSFYFSHSSVPFHYSRCVKISSLHEYGTLSLLSFPLWSHCHF